MTNEGESRKELMELSLSELRENFSREEIEMIDAHQRELAENGLPVLHETSFVPTTKTEQQRGRFLLLCMNRVLYDDDVEDFIDSDLIIQELLQEKVRQEQNAHARAFRARRNIVALLFETSKISPHPNEVEQISQAA